LCAVAVVLIKPSFITALLFLVCVSGLRFAVNTAVLLLTAGVTSIISMGWQVHESFLRHVLEYTTKVYPWINNSTPYVLIEPLRDIAPLGPLSDFRDIIFDVLTPAAKLIVLACFVLVVSESRSRNWPLAARRHFQFVMAVTFSLVISSSIWEHYLSMLFILFAYLAVVSRHFSRQTRVLAGAAFFLAAWQNWKFVRLLNGFFQPTSFFELLLFGFLKTSPLLVIMLLLLRYHEELFGSYETEEWRHFPKGGVIAGKPGSGSASEHGPSQMDSRPDKL
jgi:hypothetical protein